MAIALGLNRFSLLATVVIEVESLATLISNTEVIVAKDLATASHEPYMSIAVPVRKRVNSSRIARSPKKRRLNTKIDPVTAVLKEENVSTITEVAECSLLSPTVVEA